MYEVYKQTLMEKIQNANFVSIQADETTDISCMSKFVILLRYVKCDGPVEIFNSFVQVQNRKIRRFGVSFKTGIGSGFSEYPQGCSCRLSEIQPELIELFTSQKNRRKQFLYK
jgi:hypothetical protein